MASKFKLKKIKNAGRYSLKLQKQPVTAYFNKASKLKDKLVGYTKEKAKFQHVKNIRQLIFAIYLLSVVKKADKSLVSETLRWMPGLMVGLKAGGTVLYLILWPILKRKTLVFEHLRNIKKINKINKVNNEQPPTNDRNVEDFTSFTSITTSYRRMLKKLN